MKVLNGNKFQKNKNGHIVLNSTAMLEDFEESEDIKIIQWDELAKSELRKQIDFDEVLGVAISEEHLILRVNSLEDYENELNVLQLILDGDEEMLEELEEVKTKRRLGQKLAKHLGQTATDIIKELGQEKRRFNSYKKNVNTSREKIEALQIQLSAIRSGENDLIQKMVDEIEKIYQNVNVEKVIFLEKENPRYNDDDYDDYDDDYDDYDNEREFIEVLRIILKPLVMKAGERHFQLGEIFLDIDFYNSNIQILGPEENYRESYWGGGSIHPHVSRNGNPCWGNAGPVTEELLENKELVMLVDYLINYCQSANIEDSAGRYAYRWEEVDEDGSELDERLKGTLICSQCRHEGRYTKFHLVNDEVICDSCMGKVKQGELEINKEGDSEDVSSDVEEVEMIRCDVCSREDVELSQVNGLIICEECAQHVI